MIGRGGVPEQLQPRRPQLGVRRSFGEAWNNQRAREQQAGHKQADAQLETPARKPAPAQPARDGAGGAAGTVPVQRNPVHGARA